MNHAPIDGLEKLDHTLAAAADFIGSAVEQVSAATMFPRECRHSLAEALTDLFCVQHAIHAIEPGLRPQWLEKEDEPESAAADGRLEAGLRHAATLAAQQNALDAILSLTRYAFVEPSHFHRWRARTERDSLELRGS
ncbi:MAG: hypothetical protein ACRYGK_11170 [Janthinobacterium lividum]